MRLRPYRSADLPAILDLFRGTVHTVCARDYTRSQLDAWAPAELDAAAWDASLLAHRTLVAEENGMIIGFADLDGDYLDRLYVHKDFQGRGVATAICDRLESETSAGRVVVHASITARPFFEKRGYKTIKPQEVERQGIILRNYLMAKDL